MRRCRAGLRPPSRPENGCDSHLEDVEVPQVYTAASTPDYKRAKWRPAFWGNYTNANRERLPEHKQARRSYSAGLLLGHPELVQEPPRQRFGPLRREQGWQGGPVRARRGHSLARRQLEVEQAQHRHRARGLRRTARGVVRRFVSCVGAARRAPQQTSWHTC